MAATASGSSIVISEIMTYGQTSKDEFVRLYNPTASAVDISGWKLKKKTSSGSESNLVSSFEDGTTIPANSEFLITHKTDYVGAESADATWSGSSYSIADNNTVLLYNNEEQLIDKVGFGEASDFEGEPTENPAKGASIQRQNNQDTDNNKNDFVSTAGGGQDENLPLPTSPSNGEGGAGTDNPPQIPYGTVVINEVVSNPNESKEWIEFYNTSENDIDITGCQVKDGSAKIYTLNGTIYADSFLIIEINNRLNNGGDAIYLSDASNNSIHQLSYGDWAGATVSAPKKGESISRQPDETYAITSTPTKNYTNEITSTSPQPITLSYRAPTSTAPQTDLQNIEEYIIVSEILPNPEGGDAENEWIEFYNGSNQDINLGGTYLDDDDGGSKPYQIPQNTIIKANNYLLFLRTKTNLALNNDTDSVRILDFEKEEIKTVEYDGAKEGYSYACLSDEWQWTSELTPLAENIINLPLRAASGLEANGGGGARSATGVVVVPPNLFSTQTMYINGLQLYMYYADWPELKIGDKISVWGEPSTYYSEPRLKLKNKNSITLVSQNNAAGPEKITGDGIDDEYVGRLIIIEGEVTETSSQKMYLDANGTEITIYNKTDLKFSDYKEKDLITAVGVLSKYNNTYRILPRDKNDLKIIKQAESKTANALDEKSLIWQYVFSTLGIGATLGGALYIKRRRGNGRRNQGTTAELG